MLPSVFAAGCGLVSGRALESVPAGEWTQTLGDAGRAPFVAEAAPEAPAEQWQVSIDRGVISAPVLTIDPYGR